MIHRDKGMKAICDYFHQTEDMRPWNALEFFAREGDWQTLTYANRVAELSAWEIDSTFETNLRKNLPQAKIEIGNSFELAKKSQFFHSFDFVVLDNPQNTYGSDHEYCEHFEAIGAALPLMKDTARLVFNVNLCPYNLSQHPKWSLRRNTFYGLSSTEKLDAPWVQDFYTKKIKGLN